MVLYILISVLPVSVLVPSVRQAKGDSYCLLKELLERVNSI